MPCCRVVVGGAVAIAGRRCQQLQFDYKSITDDTREKGVRGVERRMGCGCVCVCVERSENYAPCQVALLTVNVVIKTTPANKQCAATTATTIAVK